MIIDVDSLRCSLNHIEGHVRHMPHLALIVADVNKLLAKNAQILIDFLDDSTVQISSAPTSKSG